jgi:hypothetical protein
VGNREDPRHAVFSGTRQLLSCRGEINPFRTRPRTRPVRTTNGTLQAVFRTQRHEPPTRNQAFHRIPNSSGSSIVAVGRLSRSDGEITVPLPPPGTPPGSIPLSHLGNTRHSLVSSSRIPRAAIENPLVSSSRRSDEQQSRTRLSARAGSGEQQSRLKESKVRAEPTGSTKSRRDTGNPLLADIEQLLQPCYIAPFKGLRNKHSVRCAQGITPGALCAFEMSMLMSCSSHDDAHFAASFIDPRAE